MLLKIGSTGNDVKTLQRRLGMHSVDGDFGPGTEKRVKEWQKEAGLPHDGLVGDITWNKLFPPGTDNAASDKGKVDMSRLVGMVPPEILDELNDVRNKFKCDSPLRLAHFLAQCAKETENFTKFEENLNYKAERLMVVFKKHFKNLAEAETYAHKPEAIANRVYANRYGNGDEASGDGWKYRGRGCTHTTFEANYAKLTQKLNVDFVTHPDLVAGKYKVMAAISFFEDNKLFPICDEGSSLEVVTAITKKVQGGTDSAAERYDYFKKFYAALK